MPRALKAPVPGEAATELAWLIVETGIGEELAGRLEHVEFVTGDRVLVRWPIDRLEAYVRGRARAMPS